MHMSSDGVHQSGGSAAQVTGTSGSAVHQLGLDPALAAAVNSASLQMQQVYLKLQHRNCM